MYPSVSLSQLACFLDRCVPNPCKHAGDCSLKGTFVLCKCKIGWTGKFCTVKGKIQFHDADILSFFIQNN